MKSKNLMLEIFIIFMLLFIFSQTAYATSGIVAFGNFTYTVPAYRDWTGTAFQQEQAMPDRVTAGTVGWVVVKSSRNRNETAVGMLDSNGRIWLYVRNNTYDTWTDPLNVSNVGTTNDAYRGFDIAYEQVTGDAIVVYEKNTAANRMIYYRIWDGTTWSDENTITLPGTVAAQAQLFISMEPRAGTDEILMACDGAGDDITTAIWDGTTWNNITTITTDGANVNEEKFSIAWESISGNAMIAWGAGAAEANYSIFDSQTTTWSAQGLIENRAAVVQALWLCADPTSNYIGVMMGPDSTGDVMAKMWDGSAWTTRYPAEETSAENVATKNAVCAWTKSDGVGLFTYVDNAGQAIRYLAYNRSSNNWTCTENGQNVTSLNVAEGSNGPCTTGNIFTDDVEAIHMISDPLSNQIMVMGISLLAVGSDLEMKVFDGSSLTEPATTAITNNLSSSTYESADFAYNKYFLAPLHANGTITGNTAILTGENTTFEGSCEVRDRRAVGVHLILQNSTNNVTFSTITTDDTQPIFANVSYYELGNLFGNSSSFEFTINVSREINYTIRVQCNATDTLPDRDNTTGANLSVRQAYGWLNVTLLQPDPHVVTSNVVQNRTFVLMANVTCAYFQENPTAICGQVNGTARYNYTSPDPNTQVNTTSGHVPFWSTGNQTCGFMNYSNSCSLNWTVNATGRAGRTYKLDVLFKSNRTTVLQNDTENANVSIIGCGLDFTIRFTSINFGAQVPHTDQNAALGNGNNWYNISINPGSCKTDLYIKGNDLANNSFTEVIGVGNITWSNVTNAYSTSVNLTKSFVPIILNVSPVVNVTTWYWLNVPPVFAGIYNGSLTITGVMNGDIV